MSYTTTRGVPRTDLFSMANVPIDWSKVSDEALEAFLKRNEERLQEQTKHLQEEYVDREVQQQADESSTPVQLRSVPEQQQRSSE